MVIYTCFPQIKKNKKINQHSQAIYPFGPTIKQNYGKSNIYIQFVVISKLINFTPNVGKK